jgi:hypothetical protein
MVKKQGIFLIFNFHLYKILHPKKKEGLALCRPTYESSHKWCPLGGQIFQLQAHTNSTMGARVLNV